MMLKKTPEQPLNWLGIFLNTAQRRLVPLICVFAILKIMGLEQIVTARHSCCYLSL